MTGEGSFVAAGDNEVHSNDSATTTNAIKNTGHKRSPSGGFLSKLPFLRSTSHEDLPAEVEKAHEIDDSGEGIELHQRHAKKALASALSQERKTRRRKGSLRKVALLGTSRRERRSTLDQVRISPGLLDIRKAQASSGNIYPERAGYQDEDATSRIGYDPTKLLDQDGPESRLVSLNTAVPTASRTIAATLTQLDISTTDEDDMSPFPRYSSKQTPTSSDATSPSSPESYFPNQIHKQSHRVRSPLATHHSESSLTDREWDYTETEWWGWIILIVTWLVFVVGMGSCLGVWSWAWDVGETPYAPPELEDDPTLPIVGYYPALIILTGVMAWVWVIVAWVGMKYFKHAKMSGEDI